MTEAIMSDIPTSRRSTARMLLGTCLFVAAACTQAQTYPAKSIRVIVPYPPSGGNDIIGRIVADELSKRFSQQVVVDNRPGGSTVVGAEMVAKSPPDGYTLLVTSHTTFALMPNLRPKLPYDPVKDFEPISLLASQSFTLVVHPSLPVKTVNDVIKLAKSKPGVLTFSSAGVGTGTHFSAAQLQTLAGIDIRHVPYKGGSQALVDLVGGHVSMSFGSVSAVSQFVKAGRLRMIAVTSAKRSAAAPDVPTIGESVPGYEMTPWNAIFAPAGTPKAVVDRINAEVGAAFRSAEVKERLAALGYDPEASSPAQLASHIKAEIARYGKLIKAIGFKDE